jgi:hypothetical protein
MSPDNILSEHKSSNLVRIQESGQKEVWEIPNMKAYKVELLIIDLENTGESEIIELLENTRFIYPQVKDIISVDIGDWHDKHPLNLRETCEEEYKRLFGY